MSLPPDSLLAPFPWSVRGNTVVDAVGRTVCVVFARNATAHSYWIAEVPKLASRLNETGGVSENDDDLDDLRAEIIELKAEVTTLKHELSDSEDAVITLEDTVDDLREELKTLQNKAM